MEFVGKVEEYGMKLEEKVQEKKNEKIKQDSVLSVGVALGKLRKNKSVDAVSNKSFKILILNLVLLEYVFTFVPSKRNYYT